MEKEKANYKLMYLLFAGLGKRNQENNCAITTLSDDKITVKTVHRKAIIRSQQD